MSYVFIHLKTGRNAQTPRPNQLWPGKSIEQKSRLADAITRDVMEVLDYGEDAVSVAFEEVSANDWAEKVYRPDVRGKWDQVVKKSGYEM